MRVGREGDAKGRCEPCERDKRGTREVRERNVGDTQEGRRFCVREAGGRRGEGVGVARET